MVFCFHVCCYTCMPGILRANLKQAPQLTLQMALILLQVASLMRPPSAASQMPPRGDNSSINSTNSTNTWNETASPPAPAAIYPNPVYPMYPIYSLPSHMHTLLDSKSAENLLVWQIGVCVSSLLTFAWSFVNYQRTLRQVVTHKRPISGCATACMFCWQLCVITARVLSLALFLAAAFRTGWNLLGCVCVLAFFLVHTGVMFVWIRAQGTRYCQTEKSCVPCKEWLFNLVFAVIHMFNFENMVEQPTRARYCIYYTLVALETIFILIFVVSFNWVRELLPPSLEWPQSSAAPILQGPSAASVANVHVPALSTMFPFLGVPFALFPLGIICMLIYYKWMHPQGVLAPFYTPNSWQFIPSSKSEQSSKNEGQPLKSSSPHKDLHPGTIPLSHTDFTDTTRVHLLVN